MVLVMLKNDSLDLRAIHDQVHNLVLSRRRGIAFWDGPFETAWAGFVMACHAPEHRQTEIINSIKGEILGAQNLRIIAKPYDLASCYMIAAFLDAIGLREESIEYTQLAETFVTEITSNLAWEERFHFFSTPEYVYACCLVHEKMPSNFSSTSIEYLKRATEEFSAREWFNRAQVFALAGYAYLHIRGFQPNDVEALALFASGFEPYVLEDKIPLLWFLEVNWEQMSQAIRDRPEFIKQIDEFLIALRTQVIRFFPDFVLDSTITSQNLEGDTDSGVSGRYVTTLDLLMLDEITERHSVSSLVVTRQEWERRHILTALFDKYRLGVDEALKRLGIDNKLEAIYQNLESQNPAHWSQAALACRDILYTLSAELLRVGEKSYPFIKGRDGSPMSLASDREKNRLEAYMHQIGIRSQNPLIVKQLEYLSSIMRDLIDEASGTGKRKPHPTYEQACSVVLHTYLVLGELERVTKFQIVDKIVPPTEP